VIKDLQDLRRELDGIDDRLAGLFRRRLEVVDEIAVAKRGTGVPVNVPSREREILSRVSDIAGDGFESDVCRLFSSIFEVSRARQIAAKNAPLTRGGHFGYTETTT
jgi:chorismate mutase